MSNASPQPMASTSDPAACLRPGRFVDSDHPEIVAYARRVVGDTEDEVEKARRLYLAVRDDLTYDPYRLGLEPEDLMASRTLAQGYGFCVTKAAVLAAVARAQDIPARLGYADVKNHLTTPRLRKAMGTDVFAYHGYTDLYLRGGWVKATPAFNRRLCLSAGIEPLEFDGEHDSIYHPFDAEGRRHMEYVRQRGVYQDIPLEQMVRDWEDFYGAEVVASWGFSKASEKATAAKSDDFEREVTAS